MAKIYNPQGPAITHEAIAQRAFEIWTRRGCPQGSDGREDWDAAVAELTAEASRSERGRGPLLKLWDKIRSRAALA
ncbi:MAG: DUF2934 domain-containing protein [Pirellulales bacterium]|nr:DUF2934 domain-containing protein [Pirellulales bacterium]